MEFGRVTDLAGVDFTLPADPPANARVLAAASRTSRSPFSRVNVGLAGWSDPGFLETLYPEDARSPRFLELFALAFTANELNSTYYGVTAERAAKWAAAVPDDFRFSPKLPQRVTHDELLVGVDEDVERFVEAIAPLRQNLGRAWGVLAPAFGPERFAQLEAFLEKWSRHLPLALELRHPGWFHPRERERVFTLFARLGVVAIITDVAGRRDVAHMSLTAPEVFLRFVGNSGHPSDVTRLDAWVARLAGWLDAGLESAQVFLHQKTDPEAVGLARLFVRRFERCTGVNLLPGLPAEGKRVGDRQLNLFE